MRTIHDRLAPRPQGLGLLAFMRDERGATAVEFAILALPFFVFILTILDVAVFMFVERTAKAGVDQFARYIRTGRIPQSVTAAEFRSCLCRSKLLLVDCDDVRVDLRTISSWTDTSVGIDLDKPDFSPAGPSQIKMLTVEAAWPRMTQVGAQAGSRSKREGKYTFTTRAVFMTEPYPVSQTADANQDHPCKT